MRSVIDAATDPESQTAAPWISRAGAGRFDPIDCAPKLRARSRRPPRCPPTNPLASVSYASQGNLLVIGGDERAVARRAPRGHRSP